MKETRTKKWKWIKGWLSELVVLVAVMMIFGYCFARLMSEAVLPWATLR
jgi:hypothetical protein